MSEQESHLSGFEEHGYGLQEKITYRDFSKTPPMVASRTASALELYFGNVLDNQQVGTYLSGHTLDYLYSARKGFLKTYRKMKTAQFMKAEDIANFSRLASPHKKSDEPEDIEAFQHSLVVFSVLPEMAKSPYLPKGFSRRGILAPPFTTREFWERLHELSSEITGIVGGKTGLNSLSSGNTRLWRTKLFFEVGRDLPVYYEAHPEIVEARTKDSIARLLEGIDINLD